ncbi:MAG: glycosyltransferase family 4 protein [Flavobacteriales bacterium]|nr:glycosyltransferase family 4 protein [Flavobacteriales bacterium]
MQRMLFIGSFPEASKGGTSTASLLLRDALIREGFELRCIDSTLLNVRSNPMLTRIRRGWDRFLQVRRAMAEFKPEVALLFCSHGLSFIEKGIWTAVLNRRGVKTILAPRSGLILKSMRIPGFGLWVRFAVRRADLIWCQGQYWKDFYVRFDRSDPSRFIIQPNWLEHAKESELKLETNSADIPLIIVSGWFTREKGVLDLIDILPKLDSLSKRPFRVAIYGRGPAEGELKQRIGKLRFSDRCTVHDWIGRAELNRRMRQADILLFLSYYEGMPNTILEAMRAGIAIVSTNVGAIPEYIPEENLAYLSPPADHAAKVQALAELLNDPVKLNRARALNLEAARNIPDPDAVARSLKLKIESI